MPRPKLFSRESVIKNSLMLFWKNGYYNTGIQEITEVSKINRSSLYEAFGDKEALYLECLHYYRQTYLAEFFSVFKSDAGQLHALSKFFEMIIPEQHQPPLSWGCFLVNTIVEVASHVPAIRTVALQYLKELQLRLEKSIVLGQRNGEISFEHDPEELAQFILNAFNSLRVNLKVQPNTATIISTQKYIVGSIRNVHLT